MEAQHRQVNQELGVIGLESLVPQEERLRFEGAMRSVRPSPRHTVAGIPAMAKSAKRSPSGTIEKQ
jgi:hypothetical protein